MPWCELWLPVLSAPILTNIASAVSTGRAMTVHFLTSDSSRADACSIEPECLQPFAVQMCIIHPPHLGHVCEPKGHTNSGTIVFKYRATQHPEIWDWFSLIFSYPTPCPRLSCAACSWLTRAPDLTMLEQVTDVRNGLVLVPRQSVLTLRSIQLCCMKDARKSWWECADGTGETFIVDN